MDIIIHISNYYFVSFNNFFQALRGICLEPRKDAGGPKLGMKAI